MHPQLPYPGDDIAEIPNGVRTITGVATSIAAFVGWAPMGPTNEAGYISSWDDYDRRYGGLHSDSAMSYSVSHFFMNGGKEAYIVRLVADNAAVATATVGGLAISATGQGEWAEQYGVIATPQTQDPTRFSLTIVRVAQDGSQQVAEVFQNLSLSEDDPRFAESVVNEMSQYINVIVDAAGGIPDTGDEPTFLTGGEDGDILDPTSDEFMTVANPEPPDDGGQQGGIYLLDRVELFNLLCVPGLTDVDSLAILAAFCRKRRAFLIADADPEITNLDSVAPVGGDGSLNAASYYPWLRMPDPLLEGQIRTFPPSGAVAGIYARTDTQRGVWNAPAGIEASINGAQGLSRGLTDAESGTLNRNGVNALRNLQGYGPVVWGARTCYGSDALGSEWKYVPVRRMALFIEESLYRGLKWAVFEPNDEPLWAQIRLSVGAFMHDQFRKGAFQGSTPRDAYFVKCDGQTTTQRDINPGIVNIIVGFAPLKPAEFVVITLQQVAGQA